MLLVSIVLSRSPGLLSNLLPIAAAQLWRLPFPKKLDFKSIPCLHLPAVLSVIMILVNGILEASEIANLKVTN